MDGIRTVQKNKTVMQFNDRVVNLQQQVQSNTTSMTNKNQFDHNIRSEMPITFLNQNDSLENQDFMDVIYNYNISDFSKDMNSEKFLMISRPMQKIDPRKPDILSRPSQIITKSTFYKKFSFQNSTKNGYLSPYVQTPSRCKSRCGNRSQYKGTSNDEGGILLSDYLLERGIRTKYTSPKNENAIIQNRPVSTPQNTQKIKPDYFKQNQNIVDQVQSMRYTPLLGNRQQRKFASPRIYSPAIRVRPKKNTIDERNPCQDPEENEREKVFRIDLNSINLMQIQERQDQIGKYYKSKFIKQNSTSRKIGNLSRAKSTIKKVINSRNETIKDSQTQEQAPDVQFDTDRDNSFLARRKSQQKKKTIEQVYMKRNLKVRRPTVTLAVSGPVKINLDSPGTRYGKSPQNIFDSGQEQTITKEQNRYKDISINEALNDDDFMLQESSYKY